MKDFQGLSTALFGWLLLDGQHLHMARILDALERELSDNGKPAILEEFLFDLSAVVVSHFAHEETRFRDCAYADAEAHLADHRKMIGHLAELSKGLSNGTVTLDRAAIDHVRSWFNHHLVVFDGPYMQALASIEGRSSPGAEGR